MDIEIGAASPQGEPEPPAAPRKQRVTLGGRIAVELEACIVDGVFSPGQKLDEIELGQQFSVSRTPIREALRALAAKGLVEFQPRIGAIVASPTVGEVMDLFELVAELEGVGARLAAERMTEKDLQRIIAAHTACQEAAVNAAQYYETNRRFHRAILEAAQNKALLEQTELLDKRLSPYRRFITFRRARVEILLREHEEICKALNARDGERAASAMRSHVQILAEESLALAKSLRF